MLSTAQARLLGLLPQQHPQWPFEFPGWMRFTLILTAIYNVVWGGVTVLFPLLMFNLFHMPTPLYPELWQCVGMIVGVYGVGYLAAASNPYRHWPIVLVGLLGKVLGPIGFAKALIEERFPLGFGLNILTNDLIWWVPFFLMLRGAYQHWRKHEAETTAIYYQQQATTFNHTQSQHGDTLAGLSHNARVLVVFIRHQGCIFCQAMLDALSKQRQALEAQGVRLAIVHMSPENDETYASFKRYGLHDVARFSDRERILYKTLGFSLGSMQNMFGLASWVNGFKALFNGYTVDALQGDGFQRSGVALIQNGHILASEEHRNASDTTDFITFIQRATTA
jgi:peroxiredoxin